MFKLRAPLLAKFGVTTTPFEMPDISIGLALLLLLFFFSDLSFTRHCTRLSGPP